MLKITLYFDQGLLQSKDRHVDTPDCEGRSPKFCSCYVGRYKLLHVVILLDCACCWVHVNGTRLARATVNAVISSRMRPYGLLEGARLPAAQCNTRELYPSRRRNYVAEPSVH